MAAQPNLPTFSSTARIFVGLVMGVIDLTGSKKSLKETQAAFENIGKNISPDVARAAILENYAAESSLKIPRVQDLSIARDNIITLIGSFNSQDLESFGKTYMNNAEEIAKKGQPLVEVIEALNKQYANIKKELNQAQALRKAGTPVPSTLKQELEIHIKEFVTGVEKCANAYRTITSDFDAVYKLAAKSAPTAAAKLEQEKEAPRPDYNTDYQRPE